MGDTRRQRSSGQCKWFCVRYRGCHR